MKTLIAFVICTVSISNVLSQQLGCPITNGQEQYFERHLFSHYDPNFGVILFSKIDNEVKSVLSGHVIGVLKFNELYTVIIQKNDTTVAYKDLTTVSVKEKQSVKGGEIIGMLSNVDGRCILRLSIWVKTDAVDPRKSLACLH
jgi:hypothetical protein